MRTIDFVGDSWLSRYDEGEPHEDILRIAAALGQLVCESQPEATIYVGYDTRLLSIALAHEVAEVIAGFGLCAKVSDTHCPVPALYSAVRQDPEAYAGFMLTAGSKPFDYVGVRVCMADGSSATPADTDALESYLVPELPVARGEAEDVDLITPYLENISAFFDGEAIAKASPLVVCDAMHGAMTSHAARLLGSLGARVIELHGNDNDDYDGLHPEAAEPWIDDCEKAVVDAGASFGIALDGPGDRLALIDDKGRHVTPHIMVAIIMEYLVRKRGLTGRMVAPIFVSSVVKRQSERLGLALTITPAGYTWLREEMGTDDVVCAADALGGVGIPAVTLERNALAAAAALVDAIARDGRSLSEIVSALDATIGHMVYGRRDVRMGAGDIQSLRNLMPGMNPAQMAGMAPVAVSHATDSLRITFEGDAWVLLRPSRTNNVVRVYAEAATPALRDELLSAGATLAQEPFSAASL